MYWIINLTSLKKIYISSDHAGFKLKEQIKKKFSKKYEFDDLGTTNSTKSVNHPDYAHKLCKKVQKNQKKYGNFDLWVWYGYVNGS